jgi:ubiquinone/menaquinone biosynthesis C-methylase UbiE
MKTQKNIALEFNEFSKNYTNDMIGVVPRYLNLLSSCVGHFPKNFSPQSILDLGCGNGNLTTLLLKSLPKATVTLVDASSEMIELCRKQFENYDVKFANS